MDVSFSWVCPIIDHEFRCNIVKVAVDVTRKFMIKDKTDNKKLSNCLLSFVASSSHLNYKTRVCPLIDNEIRQ